MFFGNQAFIFSYIGRTFGLRSKEYITFKISAKYYLGKKVMTILVSRTVDPHSFYADPDPAVFLNVDPDPEGKMNADPDPA